ncbi:MAG TPA: hypothetical protein PKD55_15630 [Bellilinea sp.]|nr:hypothetical protein [Bellilinea sp.]
MNIYKFSDNSDDAIPVEEIEIDLVARSNPVDPRVRWRSIAMEMPSIARLHAKGRLSPSFDPGELFDLSSESHLERHEAAAVAFLMHIWNANNPFDLSLVNSWGKGDLRVFTNWAVQSNGIPMRVFLEPGRGPDKPQ